MKKAAWSMPESILESYFDLSSSDQRELLQSLAPILGRRAEILEKDIWLCQVLSILFRLKCRKPMAFKGGTSLSKIYKAIDRFSEDIDITIDYRSLIETAPNLDDFTSRSQRTKFSDSLKTALIQYITKELLPELQEVLSAEIPQQPISIEVSDDAEKIWIFYPSAVENSDPYLRSSILVEFGGRNSSVPQSTLTIHPDVAEQVPGLCWPAAEVAVLSGARTFWEKATLIHVECHRPKPRTSAERISRHWYDLAQLADHEIGRQALQKRELLDDVLKIKETFFYSSHSHYALCASGGMRLIPDAPLLDALRQDYRAMLEAQMFYGRAPAFEAIVERLARLETDVNVPTA